MILEMMNAASLPRPLRITRRGFFANLVCVEGNLDSALGGSKGFMTCEEAEALGLFRKKHGMPRLPWPRPTLRFSATEPGMQKA